VFGLPDASPEDAANALRCADQMIVALDRWNADRAGLGDPPLNIGIGLNYGPAVMGDVGSEHSLSFTVIGDTVNTASRLQGLTRGFATPLVAADALVAAVAAAPPNGAAELLQQLEDKGEQTLRGRTAPVRVWTRRPGAGFALPAERPLQ
jgi:adenylate cyclase